jgi:hypothetical protein
MKRITTTASPWSLVKDAIVYPNTKWICRCGVGHTPEERNCVSCGREREIFPDDKEQEQENVNVTREPQEA